MITAAMIVKNESKIINRCLDSLRGRIDLLFVIDTGSDDGTPDLIRASGIPSIVLNRPWVNFGYNRTEVIQEASRVGGYLLLIDADQTLDNDLPKELTEIGYNITYNHGGTNYDKLVLLQAGQPWRFEGATHEYLTLDKPMQFPTLPGVRITEHADSIRRTTDHKFTDDIAILEKQIASDPRDSRAIFYLARSYDDLAATKPTDPEVETWKTRSRLLYQQRAGMRGWNQEIYYSLLRIGTEQSLFEALKVDPSRWEARYALMLQMHDNDDHCRAYKVGKIARRKGRAPSGLFQTTAVYSHQLDLQFSVTCFARGMYDECIEVCVDLLTRDLPDTIRQIVTSNLQKAREANGTPVSGSN
jgi:glycosyltransferase involved in cell wall biosynthesis